MNIRIIVSMSEGGVRSAWLSVLYPAVRAVTDWNSALIGRM